MDEEIKVIALEELISVLNTIIGNGNIIIYNGVEKEYVKGDVMIYFNNNEYLLFKCLKDGAYTIPNNPNFKKICLRGK